MNKRLCKARPGRILAVTGNVLDCFLLCHSTVYAQPEKTIPMPVMNTTLETSRTGGAATARGPEPRAHDDRDTPGKGDLLRFMENQTTFLVKDFTGEAHQRPEMGCEFSDFGSWYDIAYSGGSNRFWMNSVRHHTYDQVGFNAANDVGLLALFFQTSSGDLIDGSDGECNVRWYPYGWRTTTRQSGVEIESTTFFSAFNTVVVLANVKNAGNAALVLTPSLLVTGRSE